MSRKASPRLVDAAELVSLRDGLFQTGSSYVPVLRSEIVGIDSVIDPLKEVADWLQRAEWFEQHNSRLEPGILLYGPPGTGKTMAVRYLATASNALFIAVRDFAIAGDVITAADLADLFSRARVHYADTKQPVIVFGDECEGYAKRRSEGSTTRDASVVSQLMSELDGVNGKCTGVLFVGCTNFEHSIDAALKRHGRLGLQLEFAAPDRRGKIQLLRHYLGKYPLSKSGWDLESASYFLPSDATAATIEEACASVWRKALGSGDLEITQEVLNEVLLQELLGPPRPFSDCDPETLRLVALHELGHALVAKRLRVPIQVITIRPGANTFGRVITESEEHDGMFNADQHRRQITIGLGALAIEDLLGLVPSSGLDGDTKNVTKLVVSLVEKLAQHSAMSWVGPVNSDALDSRSGYSDEPAMSQALLEYFDREESRILNECRRQAYSILEQVKDLIYELADRLVVDRIWTGKQFDQVYAEVVDRRLVPTVALD